MYVEDGRHQLAIPYFEHVRRLGPEGSAESPAAKTSYHRAALEMLVCAMRRKGPRQSGNDAQGEADLLPDGRGPEHAKAN